MRVRMTLLWLSLLTATAAGETAPACWMPGDLAYHKGDERVQKAVARIAPPQRMLAEFSPTAQRGAIRRVKLTGDKKLVALTFDLCEQPSEISGYQGGIVDFLRENRIKATFFMGGKWMLSHRERTQQLMSDPLFEVANHTWEHRNLRVVSGQALVDEIKNAQVAYEQVREELEAKQCTGPRGNMLAHEQAPRRLNFLRFPYGACSAAALNEAAHQGLLPIQWDVSSGDPTFAQSARAIQHQVLTNIQPGSIVLFHANGRGWHTDGALPGIIAALKARGYEFATVSELLAAGEPVVSATCYDSRPGDTDRPRHPLPVATSPFGFGWLWHGVASRPATSAHAR
jgi:peptidoglycan-N-acetylglucosamine deacetylase